MRECACEWVLVKGKGKNGRIICLGKQNVCAQRMSGTSPWTLCPNAVMNTAAGNQTFLLNSRKYHRPNDSMQQAWGTQNQQASKQINLQNTNPVSFTPTPIHPEISTAAQTVGSSASVAKRQIAFPVRAFSPITKQYLDIAIPIMDDIISKCKTFSQTNMSQMGSPDSSQCAAVYKRMHYDQLLTATYYFKRRKVHRGPRASVDQSAKLTCFSFHISDAQKILKVSKRWKLLGQLFHQPHAIDSTYVSSSVVVMENRLCVSREFKNTL